MSIRGGGHQVAGSAVCDDGLVIDLSGMTSVTVDPAARTARVGAGARWADVNAPPSGTVWSSPAARSPRPASPG